MPLNEALFASASIDLTARADALLARFNPRDRAAIEKHLAACDGEPDRDHATLWRRMAGLLGSLTPVSSPRRSGNRAVQFFVPDGPYRKQVFALEDCSNGVLVLYLPDVLSQALDKKIICQNADIFLTPDSPPQPISLTVSTAANTPGAPAYIEHLLGWNRKALRLVLSCSRSHASEVSAAESLCRLAAADWL